MRLLLLQLGLLLLCTAVGSRAESENLLVNGKFSDGLKQWKVTFPEANETKYGRNHQWTEVVAAPVGGGKCLQFTLNNAVASSEGVKACSELIKIEPGATYEFGADVMSAGPSPIIFIEGYKEDPERQETGDNQYPGFVRTYRATIQVKDAGGKNWKPQRREITPKGSTKGNQPTHLLVKLYAYYPEGKIWFRNVFLRKVKDAEPPPKSKPSPKKEMPGAHQAETTSKD